MNYHTMEKNISAAKCGQSYMQMNSRKLVIWPETVNYHWLHLCHPPWPGSCQVDINKCSNNWLHTPTSEWERLSHGETVDCFKKKLKAFSEKVFCQTDLDFFCIVNAWGLLWATVSEGVILQGFSAYLQPLITDIFIMHKTFVNWHGVSLHKNDIPKSVNLWPWVIDIHSVRVFVTSLH